MTKLNKRLWEIEHPYYMCSGNYYENDHNQEFADWESFIQEWGDADLDYNRIHRWDFRYDDESRRSSVEFYYVLQRKAILKSCEVWIDLNDETERKIREFLRPHAEYNAKLWEGILDNKQQVNHES
jgi:hypothetical protein